MVAVGPGIRPLRDAKVRKLVEKAAVRVGLRAHEDKVLEAVGEALVVLALGRHDHVRLRGAPTARASQRDPSQFPTMPCPSQFVTNPPQRGSSTSSAVAGRGVWRLTRENVQGVRRVCLGSERGALTWHSGPGISTIATRRPLGWCR